MSGTHPEGVDLVVDLNSEDESGLPWSFIDEERYPGLIVEGILDRRGRGDGAGPVAQVAEIDGRAGTGLGRSRGQLSGTATSSESGSRRPSVLGHRAAGHAGNVSERASG